MTKHTHGPWQVMPEECDRQYIRIRGTVLGGRYKVANVLTPVYADVHPREADETRANARLIAAAPDLLEALKSLVEDTTRYIPSRLWDEARAAIAKAEGK
jgi:hypothetical protein